MCRIKSNNTHGKHKANRTQLVEKMKRRTSESICAFMKPNNTKHFLNKLHL